MPVPFRGRLYGQDEIIEVDEVSDEEREQLDDWIQRRYIKVLEQVKTADMAPEPGRGYKRR